MIVLNPRRRRRSKSRRRASNRRRTIAAPRSMRRHKRHHRRNPGTVGAFTSAFKPKVITHAIPFAGGVLLNRFLQDKSADLLGSWWHGIDFHSGIANTAVGLSSAGAMLLIPKYGRSMFTGGMVQVTIKTVVPLMVRMFGFDAGPLLPPPPAPPPAPAPRPAVQQLPDSAAFGYLDDDDEAGQFSNIQMSGMGRPWVPGFGVDHVGNVNRAQSNLNPRNIMGALVEDIDIGGSTAEYP